MPAKVTGFYALGAGNLGTAGAATGFGLGASAAAGFFMLSFSFPSTSSLMRYEMLFLTFGFIDLSSAIWIFFLAS